MNKIKILLMVLLFVFTAGICKAESSSSNEDRIAKLEAALAAMQAELGRLKAQQAKTAQVPVDQEKLDAMVSKMLEGKKPTLN